MSESVTISRKTPASKSLQYDFLRDEAIAYIQRLAGKIWTDYNIHDPGVTILEVLCYAITELGYRASFDIEDLLAGKPGEEEENGAGKQFFTAREILPNCPVTIDDYRKLLIDVDIHDSADTACPHVGVRNAWIEPSPVCEIPVYVHKSQSRLDYLPDPHYVPVGKERSQPSLTLGILYDILLEFETCDAYGDLNENTITGTLTLENQLDAALDGLLITVSAGFPRWDSEGVDWGDETSIRSGIENIALEFLNLPGQYEFSYETSNGFVKLMGLKVTASDIVEVKGLAEIESRVNDFLYTGPESLLALYRRKITKINEIIAAVRCRLHANRNLCEDFYRLKALRIEKIAVCADIELEREADVEEVQARMYHEIAQFLSPRVYFYTLEEMLDKGRESHSLAILDIDIAIPCFSVGSNLEDLLAKGDTVAISGSRNNDGNYTVESITVDATTPTTKVYVKEAIASELLSGQERLIYSTIDQESCLSVDEIFEGPALEHGFIDNRELGAADRKKYIHVSDLIRIIMGIEGVIAVSSIQVANIPQDNADKQIPSKSVKWCLELAYEQNYVPRLSIDDSKITFYKDRLPFKASPVAVEERIDELEKSGRAPKLFDPVLDFPVPSGRYRDLEQYASIQNDFPVAYGVGDEGLMVSGSDQVAKKAREAAARQLKGFLMHFDQLLANYFSQLAHVRELFSMQAEKDRFGRYVINRTYFTQPLFDIVPDADKFYVDKVGHAVVLNELAEDEALFNERKNRFLDHLIGRFAERFTDYAMLTYTLSGKQKAPGELIEDKLAFLNAYPYISSERGKGLNHQDSCRLWHLENSSGLRQRVSFLAGINEPQPSELHFSPQFAITPSGDGYAVQVSSSIPELLLESEEVFSSDDEARLVLERMVTSGINKENYTVHETGEASGYNFTLDCQDSGRLGMSARTDYPDKLEGGELDRAVDVLVQLFRQEYDNNIESNRNNLACAMFNYIEHSIEADMVADPPVAVVSYSLFAEPLRYDPADVLASGHYDVIGSSKSNVAIVSVDTAQRQIVIAGNIAARLQPGDVVVINDSHDNDSAYTVASAADVDATTRITVEESVPADTLPLGELLYNNESEQELLAKAEAQLPEIFWELIKSATLKSLYYFDGDGGAYRFRVVDKAGNDIAESAEADFNEPLCDEIANLVSGVIWISGSTGNNGEYGVDSVRVDGTSLTVTLSSDLPSSVADGEIGFTESFDFTVDSENQAFLIRSDLTGKLFVGDTITIAGSGSNDGACRIFSISFDGAQTAITVEKPIVEEPVSTGESSSPNDDSSTDDDSAKSKLLYSKSFAIDTVTSRQVTFKGGYDVKAVDAFIGFIRNKFFSREGYHVIEHVLLRPKVKGMHFVGVDAETFTEGLDDPGTLYCKTELPLFSASATTNIFRVNGNLTSILEASEHIDLSSEIRISGTLSNDGVYRITSIQYESDSDQTAIRVAEDIFTDIPFSSPSGTLSFMKGMPISTVSTTNTSLTIADTGTPEPAPGEVIEIRGSTDERNDGRYMVGEVIDHDEAHEIILSRVERYVEDRLLEIVLDETGGDLCRIEDPYTCVASIILPHWQGRFDNMNFRRFFERQLREEAPAHVFLNICWINCRQMAEFEAAYRAWLAETVKEKKDYGLLSARLSALIDILGRLHNVYPSGVLHDCDKDTTLEDAIILDNSVLGNA